VEFGPVGAYWQAAEFPQKLDCKPLVGKLKATISLLSNKVF
jgi:hypothetical protein